MTDVDRAHTLAHLFAQEDGGDLTTPPVHQAAAAALAAFERSLLTMRRTRRLANEAYVTALTQLRIVRDGLMLAAKPGLMVPPDRCDCPMSRVPRLPHEPESPPDKEFRDVVQMVATWTARNDPESADAAAGWIQDAAAKPGNIPDQVICFAAALLARTMDQGNTWHPGTSTADPEMIVATQTADALVAAARDTVATSRQATTNRALKALHHASPTRLRHRRQLVLREVLTPLGSFLRERALGVARTFYQDGGGYLADPAAHNAAEAALSTFEKTLVGMHHTGQLGEDTYLALLTERITLTEDFALAARFTSIPRS